ncbi:MAG: tetratricopeptide repeat protein [Oligoflexales bacterium]|nr:tetratricopeptide repeat protein [Oligoflexales bacterium]
MLNTNYLNIKRQYRDLINYSGFLFFFSLLLLQPKLLADEKIREVALEIEIWEISDDNQLATAEKKAAFLLQTNPDSAYYHYLYTKILLRQHNLDPLNIGLINKIQQLADQTLALGMDLEFGHLIKAEMLDLIGASEDAVKLLAKVAAQNSIVKSWRYHLEYARILVGLGPDSASTDSENSPLSKSEQAIKEINRAMQLGTQYHNIIVPFLLAFHQANETGDKFLNTLTKYSNVYRHPYINLTLAQTYIEMKKPELANELYKNILASDSNNIEALVNDAILQLKYFKNTTATTQHLKKVLLQKNLSREVSKTANLLIGETYLVSKNTELAKNHFMNAIKHSDEPELTLKFISKIYKKNKNIDELVDLVNSATKKIPGIAHFHAVLAEAYASQAGKQQKALKEYKNAILLDPEESSFYNGVGLVYYSISQYKQALNAFQAALLVDPNDSLAIYNLACIHAKLGEKQLALSSLSKAIALDERFIKLASEDGDFAQMRNEPDFVKAITKVQNIDVELAH